MKRRLGALAVLMMLIPAVCAAEGYVQVNYGIGGKIDDTRLGVELGLSLIHI